MASTPNPPNPSVPSASQVDNSWTIGAGHPASPMVVPAGKTGTVTLKTNDSGLHDVKIAHK